MKPVDHLNNIIQLAEVDAPSQKKNELVHKTFDIGHSRVSFFDANIDKYDESLKALYQNDKSVYDTCTIKNFESELIDFLRENFSTMKLINEEECKSFFTRLLSKPIQKFSVLRDVYGLVLNDPSKPFTIGPFTFYHFPSQKHLLNSKSQIDPSHIWIEKTPDYLIETKVKARYPEKAIEIADILFEKFELSLGYAIGFNNGFYEVGVLNYIGNRRRGVYVFSEDNFDLSIVNMHGAYKPIPIDDPYFSMNNIGLDRMWVAIASENTTELQRRLLLAIEWIGQAYNEISPASAFLKSAIALEILFTQNEKTLINASILNQIAESIALLMGRNSEERLKIESEVKDLYSKRSAITHAGKKQVAQEDLFKIFRLSREVVIKLMTNSSLKDLKSINEVHTYLKSHKYSCGEIL